MIVNDKTEIRWIDYWKAVTLDALNIATYEIAIGKTLLNLAERGKSIVHWSKLPEELLDQNACRLPAESVLPQQLRIAMAGIK